MKFETPQRSFKFQTDLLLARDKIGEGRNGGRRRQGDDPGNDDVPGDAPAYGRDTAGGTDADDGAGNGMRGRHWNTKPGGGKQSDRATRLGTKALHRVQPGDLRSHGVDDTPAAEQ